MKNVDRLRFSMWWTILGVILVATVVYMSLIPLSPPKVFIFQESDKIMHFSAYAVMMIWFGQIYLKKSVSLSIASGLIILGMVLEILQGLSGYRTFEYLDIMANILGVVFGFFITQTKFGSFFYAFEMLLAPSRD